MAQLDRRQGRRLREVAGAQQTIARWTVELDAITRALDDVLSLLEDPHRLYTEARRASSSC